MTETGRLCGWKGLWPCGEDKAPPPVLMWVAGTTELNCLWWTADHWASARLFCLWTSLCLKVWPRLKSTWILCFWKISDRPVTSGMITFVLWGAARLDVCQFLLFPLGAGSQTRGYHPHHVTPHDPGTANCSCILRVLPNEGHRRTHYTAVFLSVRKSHLFRVGGSSGR